MTLHAKQFYKACAVFPHEGNQTSSLTSHLKCLADPPCPKQPFRVTEDMSAWFSQNKVVNGRTCYIVGYDPITAIAVLFLGTSSVPEHVSRFVKIQGGEGREPGLITAPPKGMVESIYLNFTHPVRMKVVELLPGASTSAFKHCVAPKCIKAKPLRLDEESEAVFWYLRSSYHKTRPLGHENLFNGVDGSVGGGGGGHAGHGGEGPGGHGGATRGQGSLGSLGGGGSGKPTFETPERKTHTADVYTPGTEDAPWGRLGMLRIGFDIPLMLDNADSDSEDDEISQTDTEGVIVVCDLGYSPEVLV